MSSVAVNDDGSLLYTASRDTLPSSGHARTNNDRIQHRRPH